MLFSCHRVFLYEGTVSCTSRESNDILTVIVLRPSRYHHVLYSLYVNRNSCTRFRDLQLDVDCKRTRDVDFE